MAFSYLVAGKSADCRLEEEEPAVAVGRRTGDRKSKSFGALISENSTSE